MQASSKVLTADQLQRQQQLTVENVNRIRKLYAQVLGLEAKADGDTDAATGELDEGCDRTPHPAASNGSTTARLYNGR